MLLIIGSSSSSKYIAVPFGNIALFMDDARVLSVQNTDEKLVR